MPSPNTPLCQHLHANSNRCGSPALRGEQFCFYHHPTPRPTHRRAARTAQVPFELSPIVSHADVQFALAEIMQRIADTSLDIKRANLLLECVNKAARYIR
jgi:hypothetical protein